MSVVAVRYWRERLEAVCPFYNQNYLNDPNSVYYRSSVNKPTWPDGISTAAFYSDFVAWWRERYVYPLAAGAIPPLQPYVRNFFICLHDFLYIAPYEKAKLRRVTITRLYEGSEFKEVKQQKFIFLNPWEMHVKQYELLTKIGISNPLHIVAAS